MPFSSICISLDGVVQGLNTIVSFLDCFFLLPTDIQKKTTQHHTTQPISNFSWFLAAFVILKIETEAKLGKLLRLRYIKRYLFLGFVGMSVWCLCVINYSFFLFCTKNYFNKKKSSSVQCDSFVNCCPLRYKITQS